MKPFILILAAAAFAFGVSVGMAHEAPTGQDYSKYRQPNGASCCSGHDCRPVHYEFKPDGTLVMFPEGQPVPIPGDRVSHMPSDDGRGHWCGVLHQNGQSTTYCAILPLQSADVRTIAPKLALATAPGF
jgi:hypothetical protein